MEDKAKELTESILKGLGMEDAPLRPIIESSIEKALLDANLKGYEEATDNHLKTIERTLNK